MHFLQGSILAALSLFGLAGVATAQEPTNLAAPADCWMTYGGSPARTAVSAGRALRGPVAEAWVHAAGASIVGEPLVWDGIVVLELDLGEGRRALRGIDLSSGESLTKEDTVVTSSVLLEPGLWQSDVCFRDSEHSLAGLRLWKGTAFPRWSFSSDEPVGPPLFVDGAVYVCVGDALARLQFGEEEPVWKTEGPFRGRISLYGDRVLGLQCDVRGRFFAVELSADDGRELRRVFVGRGMGIPTHQDPWFPTLAIYGEAWGISVPSPFSLHPDAEVHGVMVDPNAKELLQSVPTLPPSGAWSLLPALIVEKGRFGCIMRQDRKEPVLYRFDDWTKSKALPIATLESNPGFARHESGATVMADAVYVGGRAFDRTNLDVLWRNADASEQTSRAVPAHDSVLYVRGERELVCLRQAFVVMEEVKGAESPTEAGSSAPSWTGTVVVSPRHLEQGGKPLRSGVVDLHLAESRLEVRSPLEADSHRFFTRDVLAVLDDLDAPLWTTNGERLAEAYRVLSSERCKETLASLAVQAKKHYDADLVESLLNRAHAAGAVSPALEKLPSWIASRRRGPEISKSVVTLQEIEALLEEARLAEEALENAVLDSYEKSMGEADLNWRVDLLRSLLDVNGMDVGALEQVRLLVPEEVRPPAEGFKDGLDWLRFVRAADQTTLRIHSLEAGEAAADTSPERKPKMKGKDIPKRRPKLSFPQTTLKKALKTWPGDLIAFESEHLLVVTSVTDPGSVARTLAHGDLVCDALETMCREQDAVPLRRRRTGREPLVIYLCSTRDEYLEITAGNRPRREGQTPMEHTSGHYDPSANVTRIFLPASYSKSTGVGLERLLRTYTHELTHHWLEVNCPLWRRHEPRSGARAPGYWVVEGFASMIQDFTFDTELRRWAPQSSRSERLDLLAHAEMGQRLPWESFLLMSQWERNSLGVVREGVVPSSIRLAYTRGISQTGLFYAQAAATSHYLYSGDGGTHRGELFRFLRDYYTGKIDVQGEGPQSANLAARLNLTPSVLGGRIHRFAKKTVGLD